MPVMDNQLPKECNDFFWIIGEMRLEILCHGSNMKSDRLVNCVSCAFRSIILVQEVSRMNAAQNTVRYVYLALI